MKSNYQKYRGKCKELAEADIAANPLLTLVRGHYDCPIWGKQPHWWCVDQNGKIIDSTVKQFPSGGIGEYIPFDGNIECAECGKIVPEEESHINGYYGFCSCACAMRFVGL